MFLKEGELCAALKEECCFYVDKTGAVRYSLAKLKKDLDRRCKEYESSSREGWFESWFKHKPWFATLLSAVAGPLVILLFLLTIGPCIINRLLKFVQERFDTVQLLVLCQKYQALNTAAEDSLV